jgi:iron(III) transport system substrate-binding protein
MRGHRRIPNRVVVSISLAVGLATIAGCGGGGGGVDLTVYSGRNQDLIEPLIQRFERESGLDIEVRYGTDSASMALQIDAEGDRGRADVFLSQSPGAIGFLDAEHHLVSLPTDIIEAVPQRFRAADGHWVGTSARVRVLVYNTDNVTEDELPGSVFDVIDPRYRGRVGLAPNNPSFIDFITALRELRGDEETGAFLEALENNGARGYSDNSAVLAAVARGEIDFGLVNHYYNERAIREDPDQPTLNHLFAAGDPGSMILMTTVGLLQSGEDHRDAAERFIAFLLSHESQQYFADETLEYPLVADVETSITDLPPLADIQAPTVDLAQQGAKFKSTVDLIADSGLVDS